MVYKAAQPRSSEKNAASRAGQTPCTRWAVTFSLLEQKASTTAENRAFEEKQPLVFFTESRDHGGVKTSRSANVELEAAVARGKSRSGSIAVRGLGVRTRKTNFSSPQVALSSPRSARPSSAARQVKFVRPQPRSPAPRADPEGQFVYK